MCICSLARDHMIHTMKIHLLNLLFSFWFVYMWNVWDKISKKKKEQLYNTEGEQLYRVATVYKSMNPSKEESFSVHGIQYAKKLWQLGVIIMPNNTIAD